MRNRYAPLGAPVGDHDVKGNRLRAFYICTATSIAAVLAIILAAGAALGMELSYEVVLGLCALAIPLAVISAAVIAQFRMIGV